MTGLHLPHVNCTIRTADNQKVIQRAPLNAHNRKQMPKVIDSISLRLTSDKQNNETHRLASVTHFLSDRLSKVTEWSDATEQIHF